MSARLGENNKVWFRSERFFHTEDGWFFITREERQLGPFGTQQEAEHELIQYIRELNDDLLMQSAIPEA
ncbi:MAG: DUF6316 family protein [Kangiellaceae bacterium]|jgi:hypothetical protein|nr:DUF6316 family protein [Kangiellaceae bacterium]